jgi:hypothetical protein
MHNGARERETERERMDRLICSPSYNNVHAGAISDILDHMLDTYCIRMQLSRTI